MNLIKNRYLFFLTRIYKDFFNPTIWPIANDMYSAELKEYYFVFEEHAMANQKGGQKSIVLDSDGIPMNPTYIDVKDKNFVYFPITIGQVGLAVFQTWLTTKSEKDLIRFMKFVDWFFKNALIDEKLGCRWLTDVSLPQYKNPGPWQSAFVQSRAISILLRGYQVTGDAKYADMAEKALTPFLFPVDKGGVTSFTSYGPFYEEYTAEVPTLVLNGMIFSLCGVQDFVRVFPDHKVAKNILDDGITTLLKILPEYDLSYWSRYNLCQADFYPKTDPATVTYQHLHVTQLNMLYKLTGNEFFREYAIKFKKNINIFNIIRMYFAKYTALKKIGRL